MDEATRKLLDRRLQALSISRVVVMVTLFVAAIRAFPGKAVVIALALITVNLSVSLIIYTSTLLFLAAKHPATESIQTKWWQELPLVTWQVLPTLSNHGFILVLAIAWYYYSGV